MKKIFSPKSSRTTSETTLFAEYPEQNAEDVPQYSLYNRSGSNDTVYDTALRAVKLKRKSSRGRRCFRGCLISLATLCAFILVIAIVAVILVGKAPTIQSSNVSLVKVNLPSDFTSIVTSMKLSINLQLLATAVLKSYSFIDFTVNSVNVTIASVQIQPDGVTAIVGETIGSGVTAAPIVLKARSLININLPFSIDVNGRFDDPLVAEVLTSCGVYGNAQPLNLHYTAYIDAYFLSHYQVHEANIQVDCPIDAGTLSTIANAVNSIKSAGQSVINLIPDSIASAIPDVVKNNIPGIPSQITDIIPSSVSNDAGSVVNAPIKQAVPSLIVNQVPKVIPDPVKQAGTDAVNQAQNAIDTTTGANSGAVANAVGSAFGL